LIEATGN